jgi:hypothetical protein
MLVYDAWISGDGEPELIDHLRELEPHKPLVTLGGLTSSHYPHVRREAVRTPSW